MNAKPVVIWLLLASSTTGCLARLPPPPTPDKIEPAIADPPTTPPAAGQGRVVLDTAGESANVSRVTATVIQPYQGSRRFGGSGAENTGRSQELLCVTPCIVDLRQGAHTFVFSSREDPTRSSLVDVVVTSKVSNVRHAIGREVRYTPAYVGGWAMILAGAGFATMGTLATTVGLFAKEPETGPDGTKGDSPKVFLGLGLAMLGIGLALGIPGIVVAHKNRPQEQPGSTVTWFD